MVYRWAQKVDLNGPMSRSTWHLSYQTSYVMAAGSTVFDTNQW